ncbi:MAG: hypothetical protein IPH04_11570 [Saprospirales bacterium]|nr:hypothetical protein [Saprospirales bacterium]MBK6903413.1 hypothetical protein [Saprospirales bacterium]MBK7336754.1 hypothetical protein [Saprospirales bacterium]
MHDIEPFYHWRDNYIAAEDERSPFYGRVYDEFRFTQTIYNYYIHPQWDDFGSPTLYTKVLFADYDDGFAVLEMLGEWNDCLQNDIMFLKRDVADWMIKKGINKFVLICENVLNFHASDDCYYEEWYEDIRDNDGWICMLNLWKHVEEEMTDTQLQQYVHFGKFFNQINWRAQEPAQLLLAVDTLINKGRLPKGVPLLGY